MKTVEKRFDYIDLFKCIAILMVVSLHTGLWHTNFIETNNIETFIQYSIRLACEGVPIFVLVNGFLLLNKEFDLKKHLKKIFKIIFILIIWSIICYVLICLIDNSDKITFEKIWYNFINTNVYNQYDGHLWFLQNLIILYLFFPILKIVHDNDKKIYNYFFIIVTFFTFIPPFISSINEIVNNKYLNNVIFVINMYNPTSNNVFLFYFMIGGYLFELKEELSNRKKIIIIAGLISYLISIIFTKYIFEAKNVTFVPNYIYGHISLVFIIIALLSIIYNYKNNNKIYNKLIKSVGSNTLGIYLIHLVILRILQHVNLFETKIFIMRLWFFLMCFILSYLITLIIKKIPLINSIIKL